MKGFETISYTDKIKWRIRLSWLLLLSMVVYMVVVAETGGGDSRKMTQLAQVIYRVIFFGGAAFVVSRIVRNQKLLKDRQLLREQLLEEQDERNRYLHDKSGGVVLDLLLAVLLFCTLTCALYNMAAFYTALALLLTAAALKGAAYFIYSRR